MATAAEDADDFSELATPLPGDPGYVDAVRESLADTARPTTAQDYNLEEAAFWRLRHMPLGSVLELVGPSTAEAGAGATLAVLVTSCEGDSHGLWLGVSVLGSDVEEYKKEMQAYFKSGRRMMHLCYGTRDGSCAIGEEPGMHVRQFRWHPPGDFRAPWVNAYGLKKIREGIKMAVEEKKKKEEVHPRLPPREGRSGESDTEKRLAALRGSSPRVSFAAGTAAPATLGGAAGRPAGARAGALRRSDASRRVLEGGPSPLDLVKIETVDLTQDRPRSPSETVVAKDKRRRSSGLAEAAVAHQKATIKKERRRSRERSRSKKSKKKRKRRDRSESSSGSSKRSSSSGSSSLLPPLRRKSQRQPGSVFRMLEQQAFDFLAQDGLVEGREDGEELARRPKLFTYYQLGLKPSLDPRGRDCKELALLSRALDMLKDGKLDSLSDLLAARLIAVETATKQGWSTARHLEISMEKKRAQRPPIFSLRPKNMASKWRRPEAKAPGPGPQIGPRAGAAKARTKERARKARAKERRESQKEKGTKGGSHGEAATRRRRKASPRERGRQVEEKIY